MLRLAASAVVYVHDGSETTSDSFSYTIRDAASAVSNAAAVSVTVIPVNDPPVAGSDAATLAEGGSVTIALAANDTDADGTVDLGSIEIVGNPSHGSVALTDPGSVLYTHDGSSTTSDSFTYRIRDNSGAQSNVATVTLTVTAPPQVPALPALDVAALAAALLGAARVAFARAKRSAARVG